MKKRLAFFLAFVTLISCLTFAPVSAYAKAGATTKKAVYLKENVTYKKYDITGDGKADRIKVKYKTYVNSKSGSGEAYVYVNGKKIKKIYGGAAVDIRLVAPTKKLSFIIAEFYFKGGGTEAATYRYVKGKFKKANSGNLYKPLTFGKVVKNTKDTVYVRLTTGKYEWSLFEDSDENYVQFNAVYTVKKKKLVLKSKEFKSKANSFKANTNFYLSSNASYNDYEGPYVKKNADIEFVSLRLVKNDNGYYEPSYKISVNGEEGWLTPEHQSDYDLLGDSASYFK